MYKDGDVVLAAVPHMNRYGFKLRPAIVLSVEGSYYLVFGCNHDTTKSGKYPGKVILKDSVENQFYNFDVDTFVNYTICTNIIGDAISKKIGVTPRMDLEEFKKNIPLNLKQKT